MAILKYACVIFISALMASSHADSEVISGIVYKKVNQKALKLDIHLPSKVEKGKVYPLVVWVHGGGWISGTKRNINNAIKRLVGEGYAIASMDYRLGGLKNHPKHIQDVNDAIIYLVKHAEKYNIDSSKIVLSGGSAGAHLAMLASIAPENKSFKSTLGNESGLVPKVSAIIDFYGPTDILALSKKRSGKYGWIDKAFDDQVSPIKFITKDDPPILIFQGTRDRTVFPDQSVKLDKLYKEMGISSTLHMFEGAGHGGKSFTTDFVFAEILKFLKMHLLKE